MCPDCAKISLDVVIPTRNRARRLGNCLETLARQNCGPNMVYIVNNGSTDDTSEVIRSFSVRLQIREVFLPTPGEGLARQTGYGNAKSALVAFTDDDCLAGENWCHMIRRTHMDKPEAAIVQGRSINDDPSNKFGIAMQHRFDIATWDSRPGYRSRWSIENIDGKLDRSVNVSLGPEAVDTKNMSLRRAIVSDIEPVFDISLPTLSDQSLGTRVKQKDLDIVFEPDMFVRHQYRRGWMMLWRTYSLYGRCLAMIHHNHGCKHITVPVDLKSSLLFLLEWSLGPARISMRAGPGRFLWQWPYQIAMESAFKFGILHEKFFNRTKSESNSQGASLE